MKNKLLSLWIFTPILLGATAVLASPSGQYLSQIDKNSETFTQIVTIIGGIILTFVLGVLQRLINKNSTRINAVEAAAVPMAEHTALEEKVSRLETDNSILITQRQIVSVLQEISTTNKGIQSRLDKHDDTQQEIKTAVDDTLKIVRAQDDAKKVDAKSYDEMRVQVTTSLDNLAGALKGFPNGERIERLITILEARIEKDITEAEKRSTSTDSKPMAAVAVPGLAQPAELTPMTSQN